MCKWCRGMQWHLDFSQNLNDIWILMAWGYKWILPLGSEWIWVAVGSQWRLDLTGSQWQLDLSGVWISVDSPTWISVNLSGICISVAFGFLGPLSHVGRILTASVGILSESGIAVNLSPRLADSACWVMRWGCFEGVVRCVGHGSTESPTFPSICDSVGILPGSGMYQPLSTFSQATQLGSYMNQA